MNPLKQQVKEELETWTSAAEYPVLSAAIREWLDRPEIHHWHEVPPRGTDKMAERAGQSLHKWRHGFDKTPGTVNCSTCIDVARVVLEDALHAD